MGFQRDKVTNNSYIGGGVVRLLDECERHEQGKRWTDAWRCYGDVLERDAGNDAARRGRKQIERAYGERIREALSRGDFAEAKGAMGEFAAMAPDSVPVREWEREIAGAERRAEERRAAEAEATRRREQEEAERRAEERRTAAEAEARRKREEEAKRKAEEKRRRAEERRIAELTPEMVRIKGGCFQMGSPESETGRYDDERQHEVCVESFSMGKHEVTRGQYAAFVRETGRAVGNACVTYEGGEWKMRSGRSWRSPGYVQEDTHSVVCVSHEEATAYARWLSEETRRQYRLPTEAEWEYAARAGSTTAYPWGNHVGSGRANCRGCGSRWDDRQTAPVGSFDANAWGLHDTVGNVWEWTCSEYDKGYGGGESRCASGSVGRRVIRGGSWDSDPGGVRSAYRTRYGPGTRYYTLGFRLAQD